MPTIKLEKCPICDKSKFEKVYTCIDYLSTRESFEIYSCCSCSFRYTYKFPSQDIIGNYYNSSKYISHSDSKKGLINKLYHFVRNFMLSNKINTIKKIIPQKKDIHLLDIGCGTGYFLNRSKKEGWNAYGIEKDTNARKMGNKLFGLDILDINHLNNFETKTFDIITLWHVLEHIEDIDKTIEKLHDILKNDGAIFIALPNYKSVDGKFYKKYWSAYDVPRHLWHFSSDTFERLIIKHNFKLISKRKMPFDGFYISLLSEKYKNSNFFVKYMRAFFIGFIGYICSIFKTECSSSIIYIVKKDI